MGALGQYAVSLTAAALISGVLLSLFPEGTVQKLLRLVCGVFLAVTALSPLPGLELPEITAVTDFLSEGRVVAARGEAMAKEASRERIKESLDAYILDKALGLGMAVQPEMELDQVGIPVAVSLCGSWTEQTRQALADIITKDLGVPEEDQQWTEESSQRRQKNGSANIAGQP